MKKKIAYIGLKGIPAKSGADRVAEAIIYRIGNYGLNPYVYCDSSYTGESIDFPGIVLVRLPTLPGKYLRSSSLDLLAAFHAVLFCNYDLIHLYNHTVYRFVHICCRFC